MKKTLMFGVIFIGFIVGACHKNNGTTSGSPSQTLPPYNYPNDVDGLFSVSILKIRHLGYDGGNANYYSVFHKGHGIHTPKTLLDSVHCTGQTLFIQSNDTSYVQDFNIIPSPPAFFNWQVYSHNTKFGNFQLNVVKPVANTYGFNLQPFDTIHKQTTLTYNHPLVYCDSIYYMIQDGTGGYIGKTKYGSSNTVTFTASELSSLTNGTNLGLLQIEVYNIDRKIINNNLIYSYNVSYAQNTSVSIKN